MYDLIIIGAGPAGSNLARLLKNRYKVLLIDKRDMENENSKNKKIKSCGGLLAPDAQKMIAQLGLALPKDILVNPQIFAVRTIDMTNNIERLYQRFYLNFDRDKFDRWLVSLVPDRVEKSFNSLFKDYKKIEEGYQVRYIHKGQERIARTKALVAADGGHSHIRGLMSKAKDISMPKEYISIQQWFKCSEPIPYYMAIFDEKITDFYSWIIPKDNYILLGSALKPKDNPWERFDLLKSNLQEYGFDFNKEIKTEGAFIYRPTKRSHLYLGDDNIALVGEAAGAISPSSAQGISYALKTSLYLAQSLEDGIEGFLERYKKNVKDIKLNLLFKNLKSPAMYQPTIRHLAMKSGLQSI